MDIGKATLMRRPHLTRFLGVGVASLVAVFALTGCVTKMTGGGWMQSVVPGEKATFAVNYDVADPDNERIRGTYHDHGADVRFRFDEVLGTVGGNVGAPCFGRIVGYESQDPTLRGGGEVVVIACDEAESGVFGPGDSLAIMVQTGPYAGYTNSGPVLGGNFQAHEFAPEI